MRRTIVSALAILIAWSPAWAQLGPVQHIQIGLLDRTYVIERLHPDQAASRLPIIVHLHGLGTLVSERVPPRYDIPFTAEPGMMPVLVVHPQGVDRQWDPVPGRIKTGQRLAGTDGEQVDDIAFLRTLIDHVVAVENGDATRVYVAGVSSGGYLVPRIACEMGDRVAAVADVIATARQAVFQECNSRPVPFALIVSTTDDIIPYAGAPGNELTRLASAPDTAFFFAKHDGCSVRTETPLPHLDGELASTASLTRFTECAEGAEVLFYRVDGSGHSVPSTAPIGPEGWDASGRRNRDVDTARLLWEFFRAHQLTASPPSR
jgi:polyhydroxybutyrate depolymerase